MSNEVNQAFLRAYVKNRADVALQNSQRPAESSQRPIRQAPAPNQIYSQNGGAIRIDSGLSGAEPQIAAGKGQSIHAPHVTHRVPPTKVAATQASLPIEKLPSVSQAQSVEASQRGVWSPIGVERGMKSVNRNASGPAMMRNTGPNVPSSRDNLAMQAIAPPSVPAPPANQVRSSIEVRESQVPFVRVDQRHLRASTLHLDPIPTKLTQPPAASPYSKQRIDMPKSRHATTDVSCQESRTHSDPVAVPRVPLAPASPTPEAARSQAATHEMRKTVLPLPVSFSPSWEVDQFFWPEVVHLIQESDKDAFQLVSKHLRLANQDGLKVMAITSGERGVGRSTVAMHMARCAAASGLNVALMDADGFYPSLIDQLRIDSQHGWQDCLFENIPLEEVAVKSLADNITLFPLTSIIQTNQLHANLHRMAKLIKRISTAYDMVFLDSNRLTLEQRDLIGVSQESIIDAAIVVADSELSIKEKVDTAISILQGMGIQSIGVVQNFHS